MAWTTCLSWATFSRMLPIRRGRMMSTCIISLVHYDPDEGLTRGARSDSLGKVYNYSILATVRTWTELITHITLIATRVRHQGHSEFGDDTVVGLGEKATKSIC